MFTLNPKFGDIDAVAEPLAILLISWDSAETGISNNPAPLPLNTDADTEPEKFDTPANTLNPKFGEIEAVAEPLNINDVSKSVIAERGISLKPLPLPLKKPLPVGITTLPLTLRLPLKYEPLATEVTTNPKLGDTEAVTEPDLISLLIRASSVSAERGIFLRYCPSP